MADIVDKATRSRMMAGIKAADTKPELDLRLALHALGFRYRLHVKNLVGRPDLVFPKHRAVVFVHGCFWHRHQGCRYATIPATRKDFWQTKFMANLVRDERVKVELRQQGWRIATVWECALRGRAQKETTVAEIAEWLMSNSVEFETDLLAASGTRSP